MDSKERVWRMKHTWLVIIEQKILWSAERTETMNRREWFDTITIRLLHQDGQVYKQIVLRMAAAQRVDIM